MSRSSSSDAGRASPRRRRLGSPRFGIVTLTALNMKFTRFWSGQAEVRFFTRPKSSLRTMRATVTRQLLPPPTSATSEVTSLESSCARIIRDDTAETTGNQSDLLPVQAAYLIIRGSPTRRDHFFNCARAGAFSKAFATVPPPCQIKLATVMLCAGLWAVFSV
jgi:hypothetical protein